jgi:hypothetical protein
MNPVLGFILEMLAYLVIELLLCWTGEILLFVLTLGRRKPVFKLWKAPNGNRFSSAFTPSALLGLVFWSVLLLVIAS